MMISWWRQNRRKKWEGGEEEEGGRVRREREKIMKTEMNNKLEKGVDDL